jgi:acetyltransferase-like isoleucine patch superfamily enzyme
MRLKVILNVLREILRTNILKTIILNFKTQPIKIAVRLPILVYGKIIIKDLKGKLLIDHSVEIKFGMIRFGGNHEIVVSSNEPTFLLINGSVKFNGYAFFGQGVKIVVRKKGKIEFGNNFSLGSNGHIVSFRSIEFGKNCLISWKCNIFDTDFHFIKDTQSNGVKDNCGLVSVGNNTWIGSHVTILKNSIFPDNLIIGSNSLCSGNYKNKVKSNSIIAGNPANTIRENVTYIIDKKVERKYFDKFIN